MWDLSYIGSIGPLKLGMSRAQVATALPHYPVVTTTTQNARGTIKELRTIAEPICLYRDDKLFGVDVDRDVIGVMYKGLDIFEAEPRTVITTLAEADGSPLADYESIMFPRLCLNTGDFYDFHEKKFAQRGDVYNRRTLTLFSPGSFNEFMAEFHPVDVAHLNKA